jgi:hypothetical protein
MAKSIQVEHLFEDFEFHGHEYDVLVELDVTPDSITLSDFLEITDLDADTALDETDLPEDFRKEVERIVADLEPTDLDMDLDEEDD